MEILFEQQIFWAPIWALYWVINFFSGLIWQLKKAVSLFWAIIWGFKKVDLLCWTLFWVGLLFIVKVLRNLYESYSKTTEKDHFEWEPLHTAEDLVYTWELMSRNEKIERKAWQKKQLLCRQRHSASALFVQFHQCHNPHPPHFATKTFSPLPERSYKITFSS